MGEKAKANILNLLNKMKIKQSLPSPIPEDMKRRNPILNRPQVIKSELVQKRLLTLDGIENKTLNRKSTRSFG